jgi:hypothetical protein
MNGHKGADAVETRADRTREHPGGNVIAQMPLGKQHEIESDLVGGGQQYRS